MRTMRRSRASSGSPVESVSHSAVRVTGTGAGAGAASRVKAESAGCRVAAAAEATLSATPAVSVAAPNTASAPAPNTASAPAPNTASAPAANATSAAPLRILRISYQAVPLDLSMEVSAIHAEALGSLGHVPGALAQGGQDGVALGAVAGRADLAHGLLLGARGEGRFHVGDADRFTLAHDEETLDQVLQLADVPGPGIAREPLHRVGRDPAHRSPVLLSEPGHEVLDQERDVLAPRPQGLHVDGNHAQPIEEILAEPTGLD